MRSKPKNTARGTPWVWRTCGITDFDTPRCREVARPVGLSRPLASRAPSVLSESGGREGGLPGAAQRMRVMNHARVTPAVRPRESGDLGAANDGFRKKGWIPACAGMNGTGPQRNFSRESRTGADFRPFWPFPRRRSITRDFTAIARCTGPSFLAISARFSGRGEAPFKRPSSTLLAPGGSVFPPAHSKSRLSPP
jgi:hypothetical protein